MPANPLVSIVVRTKDRPKLLSRALKSIAEQDYRPMEVVLVNDGGCNIDIKGMKSILGDISLNYKRLRKSRGRARAGNVGIANAKGKYVGFLDDDDSIYTDHVSLLSGALERFDYKVSYSDADIAYLDTGTVEKEMVIKDRRLFSSRDFSYGELVADNYIPLICIMFSREVLEDAGGFDEKFELYEDWDLLIRTGGTYPFYHVVKTTAEYLQWSPTLQIAHTPEFAEKAHSAHLQIIGKHKEKYTPEIVKYLVQQKRMLKEKEDIISSLQGDRSAFETAVREREGSIARLEGIRADNEASLKEKDEVIARLETGLKGSNHDKERTIARMEEIKTGLESALREKEGEIAKIEGINAGLEIVAREREKTISGLESAFREKEEEIADLERVRAGLADEAKEREKTISGLENVLQEKEEEVANLDRVRAGLADAAKEREKTVSGLESALRERDGEIAKAEGIVSALENTVRDREETISALENTVQGGEKTISALENTVREKEDEIANLESSLREKDGEMTRLRGLEKALRRKSIDEANLRNMNADLQRALSIKEEILGRIYNSRGWKFLLFYYKVRDILLPPDSRRKARAAFASLRDKKSSFMNTLAESRSRKNALPAGNGKKGITAEKRQEAFWNGMTDHHRKQGDEKGSVLVAGVYLANQKNMIEHIVGCLKKTEGYYVAQKWAALFGDPPSEEVASVTSLTLNEPIPKFALINRILYGEELNKYDYVVICDDDICLPGKFLDRFLFLQEKYDFGLAQPARTHNSFIDHPFVEQLDGLKARRTRFVEIGPVVSIRRDAFPALLPFDESSSMGWGYDFVWPCLIEKIGLRMGIVDATPVDHSMRKPVENYNYDAANKSQQDFLARNPHLPGEEAFRILESYA